MKDRILLGALVAALACNAFVASPTASSGPRAPAQEHQAQAQKAVPAMQDSSSQAPSPGDPNL